MYSNEKKSTRFFFSRKNSLLKKTTGVGETDCQKNRREKQGQNLLGQQIPTCTADGSYETVQCHASTGDCWCVDFKGEEIDGTRLRFQKPDCPAEPACRRERNKQLKRQEDSPFPIVGAFIPECNEDGTYKPKQCHGSTGQCWCTTPGGKEIEGTRQRGSVDCSKGACHREREEKEGRGLLLGQFIPECNEDGSYKAKQCHGSTGFCWCTTPEGTEIEGTRQRGSVDCSKGVCHRARQEAESRGPSIGQFIPECNEDGSYKAKQCHGSTGFCWCTSPDGQEVAGTRQRSSNIECFSKGACHRAKEEAESQGPRPGLFVPQCNDDGTYRSKQCHGSTGYCWCTSPEGEEVQGSRQFGSENVNCGSGQTECQRRKEAGDLKSSRGVVGHFTPSCEADGSFSKVQCHGSTGYCWCAEGNGKEIEGTRIRFSEPNCDAILGGGAASGKCEEAKAKAEASGETPVECDEDGFFKDKQCQSGWFSTTCWCVNQDGEEIEGSRGDSSIECLRVPGEQSKWSIVIFKMVYEDIFLELRGFRKISHNQLQMH